MRPCSPVMRNLRHTGPETGPHAGEGRAAAVRGERPRCGDRMHRPRARTPARRHAAYARAVFVRQTRVPNTGPSHGARGV
eukprot:1205743-Prymnesium_polylepis.1